MHVAPLIMATVSVIYFFADRRCTVYSQRLLISAHGIAGVSLYAVAFFVHWLDPQGYRPYLALPYVLLYVAPLVLIGLAVMKFRGNVLVHLLQIPNICALLWSGLVGAMAITGDWL